MSDESNPPPRELLRHGLIDEISLSDYKVDREAVEEALNMHELSEPQQGGVGELRPNQFMRQQPAQQPFNGSPISQWINPW